MCCSPFSLLRHKQFGLNCASEDFQNAIERAFSGLACVKNISRLGTFFSQTKELDLTFNLEKCCFLTLWALIFANINFFLRLRPPKLIFAELIFANCSTLAKIAELSFAIEFLLRIYMEIFLRTFVNFSFFRYGILLYNLW